MRPCVARLRSTSASIFGIRNTASRGKHTPTVLHALFIVACCHLAPLTAAADDLASRTVILVNSRQPESVALGEFYAEARAVPRENIVALPMPDAESITWREFVDTVWQPLQDELLEREWLDGYASNKLDAHGRRRASIHSHRIAFLVTCRGTPLRVHHDPTAVDPAAAKKLPSQFRTNQSAVDSELTLLAHAVYSSLGYQPNPAFQAKIPGIGSELLVKVLRLDGPSLESARNLVTSALTAEGQGLIGRYYIDRSGPHAEGDAWLAATRELLAKLNFDGDSHDAAGTFAVNDRFDAPAFYFGWYTASINGPFLRDKFRFPPGAIALHIHSGSAGTLRSESQQWTGPLIARGVAATFGNVFEPYLQLTIRPNLLMQKLAEGAVFGEAAYFATPGLSWQAIIVGDPLYRPFAVPVEQQYERIARISAPLAAYVASRHARELQASGKVAQARLVFTRGMREHPSLALGLAQAEFELAQNDAAAAVRALGFVKSLRRFSAEDWPLAIAAARIVAQHGSRSEASRLFETLTTASATDSDWKPVVESERKRFNF